MTSELLSKYPIDKDLLKEFRTKALQDLEKTPELYYDYDIRRFKEDDLYAHKFLAQRLYLGTDSKSVLQKAIKGVKKSFKWRKEFGVQDLKREEFPAEYFDRKGCIFLKEDKLGREVVIIQVNKLRKTKPGEKKMGERFFAYWMENIYQRNDNGITIVIDCTDAKMDNVNMDVVEFAKRIFKNYYPCFLGYFLVFKMPSLLESVWNVIKKILPQAGIDRIKFVDKDTIMEYVDADKLPEYLGGKDKSEFTYDECLRDTSVIFKEKIDKQMAQGMKSVSVN